MLGPLNSKLDGWANCFWLGQVSKAYRAVHSHARRWLRHRLSREHKVKGQGTSPAPDTYLQKTQGLTRLKGRKLSLV